MTFGRSASSPVFDAAPVLDPQPGQNVLYRLTHAAVEQVWDEPMPQGGTIRLARIRFGNGQRRVVFAAQLQEPR